MRIWLIRTMVLLALMVAADGAAWWAAETLLRHDLAGWIARSRSQGWTIELDAPQAKGWPAAATLTLPHVRVQGGEASLPGGLAWRVDRVELSLALLHPWRLNIAPQGREILRLSHAPALAFTADRLNVRVQLGAGLPEGFALEAAGIAGGIAGSRREQDVRVDHLSLRLSARRDVAGRSEGSAASHATGIALPDIGRWPLGATIAAFGADIAIDSPALYGRSPAAEARAWHDGGGALAISGLTLKWGPLDLAGTAQLGLDEALQPAGSGTAQLAGIGDTLDALAGGGTISPGLAATAKAVLGLMSQPAPGDQHRGMIQLPFTLRDNTLSAGQIPLARLNRISWGTP